MSDKTELEKLVKEFFNILDVVEESDEGRAFRPTLITSCRAIDSHRLDKILSRMKQIVGE